MKSVQAGAHGPSQGRRLETLTGTKRVSLGLDEMWPNEAELLVLSDDWYERDLAT